MSNLYAYTGDKPYIFISYAHKDQEMVYPIIAKMQEDGYRVWFDEGIYPGEEWDISIAQSIDKCSYFLSLMSQNYIHSENCLDELVYARDLGKKRVLIYLEEVILPSGIAMRTNRIQSIFKYRYSAEQDFYMKLYRSDGLQDCLSETKDETQISQQITTINFSDGGTYPWKMNADKEIHDHRTIRYSNGDVYEGEYRDGKRNGHGTYRYASGAVYEGEFKDGLFHGHGTYRSANGEVYEGEYRDDKRNGHGTYRYASGAVYEGEFKDDLFHGHGTYRYADGDVYEGEYRDGKRNGRGIYRSADGSVLKGTFKDGEFIG